MSTLPSCCASLGETHSSLFLGFFQVFDGLSLAGVADFIQEQERLLEMGTQVERDGKTHLSGGEDREPQQPEEQSRSAG